MNFSSSKTLQEFASHQIRNATLLRIDIDKILMESENIDDTINLLAIIFLRFITHRILKAEKYPGLVLSSVTLRVRV